MSRLIFANHLRGLAALSVAVSHLVGVFWGMRDFVALATSTPVQGGPNPPLFNLINHPWFQAGPFGVALFFLISGLVIPISLERTTGGRFIAARLLRIYPTYLVALLIQIAILHATSTYLRTQFPYGDMAVLGNALLIHNAIGQPSIDLVNWTLCIELKFYLLTALLARPIRRGGVAAPFVVAAAILGGNLLVSARPMAVLTASHPFLAGVFGTETPMIVFMLMGVLFNYRLRGFLSLPAFLGSLALMSTLFAGAWIASALAPQFPTVIINYFFALAVFGVLFSLRQYARDIGVLRALAAVSYPFYLVHCVVGIVVLKLVMLGLGLGYLTALAIAFACTLAVAWSLHHTVETWSIALGHRLTHQSPKSISKPPASRLTKKYRNCSSLVG